MKPAESVGIIIISILLALLVKDFANSFPEETGEVQKTETKVEDSYDDRILISVEELGRYFDCFVLSPIPDKPQMICFGSDGEKYLELQDGIGQGH